MTRISTLLRPGAALLATAVFAFAAMPTSASTMITYTGTTTWTDSDGHFGRGQVPWIARFRYSDEGRLEWSRINLGGGGWTFTCPPQEDDWNPCGNDFLTIRPEVIASSSGFTPEDLAQMVVRPETAFAQLPWPNGRFHYKVQPGDFSDSYLYFSTYFDGSMYHYFGGGGPVSDVFFNVPEPATWGLMLAGFGLLGASLRRRRALA
jgi:hypothetical protein